MSAPDIPGGAQKVAAFLLSLERAAAAAVMKNLDPAVVPEVAAAMGKLDPSFASLERIDEVYCDLARGLHTTTGPSSTDETELSAMLEQAFGRAMAGEIVERLHQRTRRERPFAFLEDQTGEVVFRLLVDESPSVAALVLTSVPPSLTSEVLGHFESETMLDIVKCMATLVAPVPQVVEGVADELQGRLQAVLQLPSPPDPSERQKQIAAVLKFSQPAVERSVLEGIESENEEMAAEIREHMFAWGDLATVDKRAMQKILASVDTRTLAISLKGCESAVEENILGNLSTRVREMVADERDLAGPTPMTEVLAARKEMLTSVRTLIESGELQAQRAGEDLVS